MLKPFDKFSNCWRHGWLESPAPVVVAVVVVWNNKAFAILADRIQGVAQTIAGVVLKRQHGLL